MALDEPDDETAMGTQVLGPEKSRVLSILGPGLITAASDDDPSGIATYSQVGAQFGFSISWTMLFSYPLMAAIQEISGRIGRTTGRGVAGNIRRHYPAWLLNAIVGLLFIANTINIGADLGARRAMVRSAVRLVAFIKLCATSAYDDGSAPRRFG